MSLNKQQKQILDLLEKGGFIATRHSGKEFMTTETFNQLLVKEIVDIANMSSREKISDLVMSAIAKVVSQKCPMDKNMLKDATNFMRYAVYSGKPTFEQDLKYILENGEEPFRRYIG